MVKESFSELFDFQTKSKIKAGDGLKLNEGKYPFYTSSNVLTKSINEFLFDNPSLIFGTGGLASIHLCTEKFAVSTDCLVAQPKDDKKVLPKYVYHYLAGNIHILEEGFKGAGLKHISKGYISNIKIPLPPLETQKHIAQILDDAAALRDKTTQLIKEYDALAQSIFLDMFGDPVKNEKGWELKNFDYFAKFDLKMTTDFVRYADYPHIGIANIERDTGKLVNFKKVCDENLDSGKYLFDSRHIIYSKIRPNLNKVALPTFEGLSSADSYPILVNEFNSNRVFFAYLLRSKSFIEFILSHSVRANIPKVNKSQMSKYIGIAPPLTLQNQFAEKIALIEQQKQLVKQELKESEDLFNCLLQKAFKGELA